MTTFVNVATEGGLDARVLQEIFRQAHLDLTIAEVFSAGGKGVLRRNVRRYFQSSRISTPFIVLTDLDNDRCAPELVEAWLGGSLPEERFQIRAAVREFEAWLLASRQSMASFLRVGLQRVPGQPDDLPDPKRTLVHLARLSRDRNLRDEIVARDRTRSSVGIGYNSRMAEFVRTTWNLAEARSNSPSLERCVRALESMQA